MLTFLLFFSPWVSFITLFSSSGLYLGTSPFYIGTFLTEIQVKYDFSAFKKTGLTILTEIRFHVCVCVHFKLHIYKLASRFYSIFLAVMCQFLPFHPEMLHFCNVAGAAESRCLNWILDSPMVLADRLCGWPQSWSAEACIWARAGSGAYWKVACCSSTSWLQKWGRVVFRRPRSAPFWLFSKKKKRLREEQLPD